MGSETLPDFIEKQGPAIGRFDAALALLMRAGEGALLVAEKLALHQCLGNGAAIYCDERAVLPSAALVNGLRDHLLARAAFPENENRGIGGGDFLDRIEH